MKNTDVTRTTTTPSVGLRENSPAFRRQTGSLEDQALSLADNSGNSPLLRQKTKLIPEEKPFKIVLLDEAKYKKKQEIKAIVKYLQTNMPGYRKKFLKQKQEMEVVRQELSVQVAPSSVHGSSFKWRSKSLLQNTPSGLKLPSINSESKNELWQ